MVGERKESQELDDFLKDVPDEMRLAMLTALLCIPKINGLTCAVKPQGAFKSLGVRRDSKWFAAISKNQTGLRGYFEPIAKVDLKVIEREFGSLAKRQDKVTSVTIGTFDDMLRYISVLDTTARHS